MGQNESISKRETHSSECLQEETGESIHYQPNSTPESSTTKIRKYTQEEQEIIKLRAEINQVETKRTIENQPNQELVL